MVDVIVFKDTRRIVMYNALNASQIWVKLCFLANIKTLRMVYGLMGNSVMMVIMTQEMAVIILKSLQIIVV